MTKFSLKGKIVLVTGASSGIGKIIAIELSQQEAAIIITGRNQKRLLETFDLLEGTNHRHVIADLTKKEDIEYLVSQISSVNGVVFCAGAIDYMPAKQVEKDAIHKIFQLNFESQIELYKELHLNRKFSKGASLVFISSVSALSAVPATLIYAASKAAVSSSVRVLASELAKFKIRVNSISPGLIKTPLLNNENLVDETINNNETRYPLGFGEAVDVANAAIFLLSDETRWITGIDMVVDGGYMLHQ